MGDGFEVVDQMDGVEAEVLADAVGRQRPGQVGGDHGAIGQRVAGGGDDALGDRRLAAGEVGQDRAQPGVIGVAVLAVGQHLHGRAQPAAGLDQAHADVGAADVGREEGPGRERRAGAL